MDKNKRVSGLQNRMKNVRRKNLGDAKKSMEKARRKNEIVEIRIDDIVSPGFHDRTMPPLHTIKELADNIKATGRLLQPVTLRKIEEGVYERICGYRRIEAVRILGWETIEAVVLEDIDDDTATLLMLSENINRENLNVYDETVGLLQYLAVSFGIGQAEVKSNLYAIKNYYSNNKKTIDDGLIEFEKEAQGFIAKTGKYELSSFINRLSVLSLHPLIINAMRQNLISYTYGRELNKFNDDEIIESYIQKPISLQELKNHLNVMQRAKRDSKDGGFGSKIASLSKKGRAFAKLDESVQKEVEALLSRMEDLLEGSKHS